MSGRRAKAERQERREHPADIANAEYALRSADAEPEPQLVRNSDKWSNMIHNELLRILLVSKFHVSSDGNPRVCNAAEGNCPIGGDETHYTSKEAARAAFEESVEVLESASKKTTLSESVRTVNEWGYVEWRNANGKLHRDGDLPAIEHPDGSKIWYQNGERHRDGGLPAVEWSDGMKEWWVNGEVHRDGGLPAWEGADGSKSWLKNGKLHRDGGLPAVEYATGSKSWYRNGKLHRDDGLPAVEYADGTKEWYQNGKRHRDGDLPAIEASSGAKQWYRNGKLHRTGGLPASISADGTQWFVKNGKVQYRLLPDGTRVNSHYLY